MGLFGSQTKPRPADAAFFEEEDFDELPSLPKANNTTIIAQGITVTGIIRGEGNIQIEGKMDGEVDLQGRITIAPGGIVQGPMTADVVQVAGDVEGRITAREHLRLERTGAIRGDVATASLIVEDGRLNGSCTMLTPAEVSGSHEPDIPAQSLQFGPDFKLVPQED